MKIECKYKILFQIDMENDIKFSSPKIKIKKEYTCQITMRTLVHTLAHRSHKAFQVLFDWPSVLLARDVSGQRIGPRSLST